MRRQESEEKRATERMRGGCAGPLVLDIGGAVVQPRRLGLTDLRALEPVTLTVTT
jgi:hypothetical protein